MTAAALCAVLAAAGAMGGDAAAQSSRWVAQTDGPGAQALSCQTGGGGRICAAVYCGASGAAEFGITGLPGSAGATQAGTIQTGRSRTDETFVRDAAGPLGRPVWRRQGGADAALTVRLSRSNRVTVALSAASAPLVFSLRGSSRALRDVVAACAPAGPAAGRTAGAGPRPGPQRLGAASQAQSGGGQTAAASGGVRQAPAQTAGRIVSADPRARRIYASNVRGRWGTRDLCRTGGGWEFRDASFSTPAGVACNRLTLRPGEGPAIRLEGANCAGGQAGQTETYELSPSGGALLLTRIAGSRTATFILQRCRG